jgi:hypothetical protein
MASPPDVFLGLGNTEWTGLSAIAGGVYDVLTLALVCFGVVQIVFARREAKINRTLAACDRYDCDPVLDLICRRLAEARESGDLAANPRKYRLDLYSILNYLESIAIGVRRGLYHSAVVKDYMKPIIIGCHEEYIVSGLVARAAPPIPVSGAGNPAEDFDKMIALVTKWSRPPWHKRWFMSAKPKI